MSNFITFVIPTYNREHNLMHALCALGQQTLINFEVIVSDDGSSDGTIKSLLMAKAHFPLRFCWHEHDGYQVSYTRNQGAALRSKRTTHIWFIDSDVVLNPKAVEYAYDHIEKMPNAVICGRYDWLPPMKLPPDAVTKHWDNLIAGKFPKLDIDYSPGHLGADPRRGQKWNCKTLLSVYRGGTLSGNLIVPVHWIEVTGGFDENIKGQGQDCEFGYHLQEAGALATFCQHIIGYHLHHYRDARWMTESVRETIRYIHKKYDVPLDEDKHLPKLPGKE